MAKEPTGAEWAVIESEMGAGRKIEAIKMYREVTGVGLKEAMGAVEARGQGRRPAAGAGGAGRPTEEEWAEVEAAIFAGRKIEAIKLYREATGVGLKEAKDAVEARDKELREVAPERFAVGAGKAGCMGVVVVGVGVAAGVVAMVV